MTTQSQFDQDEDIQLMNADPETKALEDDDDDDFDGGAEFDELGSGATSGYGDDNIDDIDAEEISEEDLDDDQDDDIDEDDDM